MDSLLRSVHTILLPRNAGRSLEDDRHMTARSQPAQYDSIRVSAFHPLVNNTVNSGEKKRTIFGAQIPDYIIRGQVYTDER
jgi:hypothetical protein